VIDKHGSDPETQGDGEGDANTSPDHGPYRVNDCLNRKLAPVIVWHKR
jgi:hypothetical protein